MNSDRSNVHSIANLTRSPCKPAKKVHARRTTAHELETVTELMDAAVSHCTSDLRFLWVNRRFAEWVGLPPDVIIGKPIQEIIGATAFNELKPHFDLVLTGEPVTYDQEVQYATLGKRWVHATYVPSRDPGGQVTGWVGVISDITAEKRAELELVEANERKQNFLAVMAHELRGPLFPLRCGLHIARDPATKPQDLPGIFDMLDRQVTHLTRLVDDLQEAGRIRTSGLRKVTVDLAEVVQRTMDDCRARLESRCITTIFEVRQGPTIVQGDPDRLAQVFTNLLGNSAKFTHPGGHITVTIESAATDVMVTISDSGIGIDPEELEDIFALFVKSRQARIEGHAGFGIGLSVVRDLVTMHGGAVWAHSDGYECGSTFFVRLPVSGPSATCAEAG